MAERLALTCDYKTDDGSVCGAKVTAPTLTCWRGEWYRTDLCAKHINTMGRQVQSMLKSARAVLQEPPEARGVGKRKVYWDETHQVYYTLADVRTWLEEQGYSNFSTTGRLPDDMIQKYLHREPAKV